MRIYVKKTKYKKIKVGYGAPKIPIIFLNRVVNVLKLDQLYNYPLFLRAYKYIVCGSCDQFSDRLADLT